MRLHAARPAELAEFLGRHPAEYAEGKVLAGEWAQDDALDLAQAEFEPYLAALCAGVHRLFVGPSVWAWIGPPPASRAGLGRIWLYQILVEEEARQRGMGRETMEALHVKLAREGVREVWLNVFDHNTAARGLYAAMGYRTVARHPTSRHMRCRLR